MTERLLTIDGSQGEGGGQVLRTSLALSLVTLRPVVIENIRAKRDKPGLRRQHLTAVMAATQVGRAETQGAQLGSSRIVFRPGRVEPGDYTLNVGTAGSVTLVLQTVLPALLLAEDATSLTLEGGTHNPLAPPFDFLAKAYLPLINRMGPVVEAELVRPGFYPGGGGQVTFHIRPARRLNGLELLQRGEITARRVRALVANLPRHIAERECRTIAQATRWDERCFTVEEVKSSFGPGNVVMIQLEAAHVTEVFTGFGQRGVAAEKVALAGLRDAQEYLAAGVPVGPHLADQLILPLAIGSHLGTGGGTFRTMNLTPHSTTHIDVVRAFLEVGVHIERDADQSCLVRFAKG